MACSGPKLTDKVKQDLSCDWRSYLLVQDLSEWKRNEMKYD
jgi:hypothetical protein